MRLREFFSCYFHQDWPDEAETPSGVVASFLASEPHQVVLETLTELDHLLDAGHSEVELRNVLLADLGSYYDPEFVGEGTGSFLRSVREQIRFALSSKPADAGSR